MSHQFTDFATLSERNQRALLTKLSPTARVNGWCTAYGPLKTLELVTSDGRTSFTEADVLEAQTKSPGLIIPGDAEWPAQLNDLDGVTWGGNGAEQALGGVPVGLWFTGAGDPGILKGKSVGIVGSRSATTYGNAVASDFSQGLARDFTIISGGAFGIDQAAHRGALAAGGSTVIVSAAGVDQVYPTAHVDLFNAVRNGGGLIVSERFPGSRPTRTAFLSRNRLIAALTGASVIVEAAYRSGSINTAEWARLLETRGVMAVPGPIYSAASQGANALIAAQHAVMASDAAQIATKTNYSYAQRGA